MLTMACQATSIDSFDPSGSFVQTDILLKDITLNGQAIEIPEDPGDDSPETMKLQESIVNKICNDIFNQPDAHAPGRSVRTGFFYFPGKYLTELSCEIITPLEKDSDQ